MQESLCKDTEEKEKAVTAVRDDAVGKDRMGMPAAATGKTEYRHFRQNRNAGDKVNNPALIIRMNLTVPGGTTGGAGLKLGAESAHVGVKKGFG